MSGLTLGELAERLAVPLNEVGQRHSDRVVTGLATLRSATPDQLSFLANPRYASQLQTTAAGCLIVHPDIAGQVTGPCLLSRQPYVTYALASQIFAAIRSDVSDTVNTSPQIHKNATVDHTALLAEGVRVGPNAVIEAGAVIGKGARIGAGCFVGSKVTVGVETVLHPRVVIYRDVSVGERCIIHSGAVIGADGFGFAFDGKQSVKVAQLGSVRIGNDVEIGAGSTIDRGALDDTLIGHGVKIDNQVQIGHNCTVGDHTVICGCSALAGSTQIGRYCMIGGGVGVTGHLSICDKVNITAMSMVTTSITKPGTYSSGTLLQENAQWRRNAVTLSKATELKQKIRDLEKRMGTARGDESGKTI